MRENLEKSIMCKYGVKTIFESDEFKLSRKKTLKEKYGSEKYNNSDKTRNTRIENKTQIDDSQAIDFESYKKIVTNRTMTIYRNNMDLINPLKLKRGKTEYHIDHKFSIKQGFLLNIPIEIITHPCNLQLIHYMENLKKQDICSIDIKDLLTEISESNIEIVIDHSYLKEKYDNVKSISYDMLRNV
jgi:hypothetical protein